MPENVQTAYRTQEANPKGRQGVDAGLGVRIKVGDRWVPLLSYDGTVVVGRDADDILFKVCWSNIFVPTAASLLVVSHTRRCPLMLQTHSWWVS